MADIATAYVQIVPSARGLGSNLTSVMNGELPGVGTSAGKLLGGKIVTALKGALAAAGIGKLIKQSLMEGGELQQLQGGVEKIFNEMDTSQIFADAADAYKNLNMSANEYLATINDVGAAFSATMGDEKGYQMAKTGLQAISDYASGTGKSVDTLSEKFTMITRSTSSYQSIADQFSGILPATSADFLKQAQAAGFLAGKYKKLTDVPVAEYQEAVTKMLEKGVDVLGLTGNTAAETADTMTGSFAAMKSAFSNVLGKLALGEDITPSLNALAQTVSAFLVNNLIPMVWNIISALPGALVTFLKALMPSNMGDLVSNMISNFANFITSNLPVIVSQGLQLITQLIIGFLKGIPDFLANAGDLLDQLLQAFLAALPSILASGAQMIQQLAAGLIANIPNIISAAGSIIAQLLSTLAAHLPDLLAQGIALIAQLVAGLISMIPDVITGVGNIVRNIINAFGETDWLSIGSNIIRGIANGISNGASMIISAAKEAAQRAFEAAKSALGIKSPSRLFRAEVGYRISQGAALGITDGIPLMTRAMDDLTNATNTAFHSRLRMGAGSSGSGQGYGRQIVINQYIYSQAQTAADLMREARYEAEKAVLLGV